jgi:hypothetical protein
VSCWMISKSFERHGPLYTLHDLPESTTCTASFKGTFARTSGRVRTSKTIVIVHISYAGQGLQCNSQEKAIPLTSIKKNQSVQDREAPLSYERHPTTAKQGTKLTDRSGKNAGKKELYLQHQALAFMVCFDRNVDRHREHPAMTGVQSTPQSDGERAVRID